jgi:hypothetical protein
MPPEPDSPAPCTCPSSAGVLGATVIGVVMREGLVAYIKPEIPVNEAFREAELQYGPLERRFRFASPCIEVGCPQWRGTRCGVIDETLAEAAAMPARPALTNPGRCTIRGTCRWFEQAGWDACRVCPVVITDTTEQK